MNVVGLGQLIIVLGDFWSVEMNSEIEWSWKLTLYVVRSFIYVLDMHRGEKIPYGAGLLSMVHTS